jgi:hypothetical protein
VAAASAPAVNNFATVLDGAAGAACTGATNFIMRCLERLVDIGMGILSTPAPFRLTH